MGLEAIITIIIIVIALILFISEFLPVDVVAIGIMVSLVLTGVITAKESVLGFANNATLTVAAMFVLSDAIIRTRVIEIVGPVFKKLLSKGYNRTVVGMGVFVGGVSAFINNTPVVATFIPIINNAAKRAKLSPSKVLIPLSFVAIFGGTCTLIGTSTNLLVSGIAEENGLKPFSMFLMAPLGLVFFAAGTIYLLLFGKKLLPDRHEVSELEDQEAIRDFLTEIKVTSKIEYNNTIKDVFHKKGLKVDVHIVKRGENIIRHPKSDFRLKDNDILLIKGDLKKIKELIKNDFIQLTESFKEREFPEEETKLIEIILLPNSDIIDKKLADVDFLEKYQSKILAIRHRGKQKFSDLKERVLKPGDILLLQASERGYHLLMESQNNKEAPFFSLYETELSRVDFKKLSIVGFTIASIIALATAGIVPIMIGAFGGIVILNLFKIITMTDAYRSIDWQVIFLLAGALSLEKAMNASGLTTLISDFLMNGVGTQYGPAVVTSVLYIITVILTSIMSNNAAAALLAPIAISLASSMGVSPVPLLLAIAFAGSSSFITPIGYQTNTMVYSAGNYKFSDFAKIGIPLNILFWIIATLLLPVFYPF